MLDANALLQKRQYKTLFKTVSKLVVGLATSSFILVFFMCNDTFARVDRHFFLWVGLMSHNLYSYF